MAGWGRDGKARCEGGAALAHDVRVDCAVYSVGNADEEDELLATRDGRETLGDRPHGSLIFQCIPNTWGQAPRKPDFSVHSRRRPSLHAHFLGLFAGFLPDGDARPEFIFNSFFFFRNVV